MKGSSISFDSPERLEQIVNSEDFEATLGLRNSPSNTIRGTEIDSAVKGTFCVSLYTKCKDKLNDSESSKEQSKTRELVPEQISSHEQYKSGGQCVESKFHCSKCGFTQYTSSPNLDSLSPNRKILEAENDKLQEWMHTRRLLRKMRFMKSPSTMLIEALMHSFVCEYEYNPHYYHIGWTGFEGHIGWQSACTRPTPFFDINVRSDSAY